MNEELLDKAKKLNSRISELNGFLRVFSAYEDRGERGSFYSNFRSIFKINVIKEFSIFSRRMIGLSSEDEIKIPSEVISIFEKVLIERVEELKQEFKNLK